MVENRAGQGGQVKLERRSAGGKLIVGYAAVFFDGKPGTQFELRPGLWERIDPRAFNRALAERQDTVALFNHDVSLLLGRLSAGTLRLSVDQRGLKYEIVTVRTSLTLDVLEHLASRNLCGSSFSFIARRERLERSGSDTIRIIEDVDLLDVSPCTSPAYSATVAGV